MTTLIFYYFFLFFSILMILNWLRRCFLFFWAWLFTDWFYEFSRFFDAQVVHWFCIAWVVHVFMGFFLLLLRWFYSGLGLILIVFETFLNKTQNLRQPILISNMLLKRYPFLIIILILMTTTIGFRFYRLFHFQKIFYFIRLIFFLANELVNVS